LWDDDDDEFDMKEFIAYLRHAQLSNHRNPPIVNMNINTDNIKDDENVTSENPSDEESEEENSDIKYHTSSINVETDKYNPG